MNEIYDKVKKCYNQVREKTDFKPQIAMILGSGLGDYAETIEIKEIIDYHEIDGFPISTVQGHKGRFVLGYVEDIPVMIMEGRVHYYEGYSMSDVVLPIRLMKMMGGCCFAGSCDVFTGSENLVFDKCIRWDSSWI